MNSDLLSNGFGIPFAPKYFQQMHISHAHEQPNVLAERFKREGYLYLKAFLEPASVWNIREQYFSLFDDTIFENGTTRKEGIFSGNFQYSPAEHGRDYHPAATFVQTKEFDRFTRNEAFFQLSAHLLGGTTHLIPRRPVRHFYKGTHVSSKAHADYTYLDQGTCNLLSVWVPLGNVPIESGGIIYLRNTNDTDQDELRIKLKNGNAQTTTDNRPITGNLKAIADLTNEPWMYANYEAGDIVVHSPFIIHATLDCETDNMRLSTDLRFALASEDYDPRWKNAWRGDDGY